MLASPLKNLCVQVAKGLEAIISGLGMPSAASAGGTEAAGAQAQAGAVRQGAWMLLREVAAQDAGAPSWQFLQGCWAQLQGAGNGGGVGGVGWGVCVCGCLCGRVSLCICGEGDRVVSGLDSRSDRDDRRRFVEREAVLTGIE